MRIAFGALLVSIAAILIYQQQNLASKTISSLTRYSQPLKRIFHSTPNRTMSETASFPGLPPVPPNDPSLTKPASQLRPRAVAKAFLAMEQAEGAGARVRRSVGTPKLRNFSPFLMLDHFSISPGAGFPDHPHRGQETITYLLSGAVDHEDFAGNRGTIWPGDLQFMTAGRGIMHAEMPHDAGNGEPIVGMQLWVDLPEHLKNCEPRYRDLRAKEIPVATADDGKVSIKVISGQAEGVDSVQELAYTPVWLLDVTMKSGSQLTQKLPIGWNAFAYVLEGSVDFLGSGADNATTKTKGPQYHNVVFGQEGDAVIAHASSDQGCRFILVAGTPLDQPVVQYGPFVVTSQQKVYEALHDFQSQQNGFERAANWRSEIGRAMTE